MEPDIVEKGVITLVGMPFFGNPFREEGGWSHGNEIGKLWGRFVKQEKKIKHASFAGG